MACVKWNKLLKFQNFSIAKPNLHKNNKKKKGCKCFCLLQSQKKNIWQTNIVSKKQITSKQNKQSKNLTNISYHYCLLLSYWTVKLLKFLPKIPIPNFNLILHTWLLDCDTQLYIKTQNNLHKTTKYWKKNKQNQTPNTKKKEKQIKQSLLLCYC